MTASSRLAAGVLLALFALLAPAAPTTATEADAPAEAAAARVADLVGRLQVRTERKLAREALVALVALDRDATPALLAHRDHPEMTVRWEIAQVMGTIQDERAIPALAEAVLSDENPHVRWRSLWAISTYPDELEARAVALFKEALSAGDGGKTAAPVSFERWNAAVGLAFFEHDDGLSVLHAGLDSDDPWRRWEALNASGRVHDGRTAGMIAAIVRDPGRDGRERNEATMALGRIGGERAESALGELLGDPDPGIRWRACASLARAGATAALEEIQALLAREEDETVKEHCRRALGRLAKAGSSP